MKTVWSEFIGLFVDDGRFAVAIVAWLLLFWIILPHLGPDPRWPALLLFAGLAVILVESALHQVRQDRSP